MQTKNGHGSLVGWLLLLLLVLPAKPGRAAYGDDDYDCGASSEYTQGEIENVAWSLDNGLGHYPGLESLGSVKRNHLTFFVPGSFASWASANPAHSDREYLAIFSAGAQGVGILGTGGYPSVTTGQRDEWSDGFGGGADRIFRDVCNRGLYGRIRDDPIERFPSDRTMFVVNFDNRYLFTDEPADLLDALDAWEIYVKSLAAPERLKGVYLVGASMGGGLMAELAARLSASSDGWEKVPVIVQSMDGVLGKNRLGTVHPLAAGTAIDNLSSSDPEHYFYRTNPISPSSTVFYDAFPDKSKLRINTIIGGGVVVGGYDVRAWSYVQPAPAYNDYDLTWIRQTSVDLDHEVIGRNWNSPIVAGTGTPDSYRAMDHYRDSYNELDMWGEPVYYALDASAYGGPGSHGVEHDHGDIQTAGSPFHTSSDRSPVKLHESVDGTSHTVTVYRNITTHADRLVSFRIKAPPYGLGTTAVYGVDYTILGYGSMPAEGLEFSMLPDEMEASFVVETVYDSAVESDEYVYLEIDDGEFVGIRGNVQQGILMRIVDHNYDASPESCAAAGLLYDAATDTCVGTCAPEFPALPCAVLPSKPFLDMVHEIADLDLPPNLETSLTARAQRALTANLAGDLFASRYELTTFVAEVEAERGRGISNADADALVSQADAIVVLLDAELVAVPALSRWGGLAATVLVVVAGAIATGRRRLARGSIVHRA